MEVAESTAGLQGGQAESNPSALVSGASNGTAATPPEALDHLSNHESPAKTVEAGSTQGDACVGPEGKASPSPPSISSGDSAQMEDASASSLAVQTSPAVVQPVQTEITEQVTPKIASLPAAMVETPNIITEKAPAPSPEPAAAASPAAEVTANAPVATTAVEELATMASAKSLYTTIAPAAASASKPSEEEPPAMPATQPESITLKTLPQVAADAAKQAGNAYVEAGKEARSTFKSLMAVLQKPGPAQTLTLDQIVTAVFLGIVAFQLLILPIFMPGLFRLLSSLTWGLAFGLGLSFLYYYNKKRKAESNELLSINLGLKGIPLVAGGLPSWFSVSQNEKLEWLNRLIVEVWPYVDKGVCEMIKEQTALVMPGILASLPAGLSGIVKSIGFKHLTFGEAPFRVESMWVSNEDKESLVMEVSVKWTGDPNITLAIEIPGGQKLCPRIMDITFIATMRIMLHPLVARVPGFVAVMATVPKPPLIKYRLDFGKAMGGSMAPAAVSPVVNYFIREIIMKMLVWPQRLVIPVLQATEQDRVEIQKLMRRHRGVLRICVVSAKELRAQDWGTNDVMVELTTDSEHYECTSIRRAKPIQSDSKEERERLGETVTWNDYIFLLIQEPRDQLLRLEAFDIDRLRPSKLLTGQVTQIVNGRALVGRSLIKLADACREGLQAQGQPEPYSVMTHLGKGEWGTPGGPGKGHGKVRLSMTYWPFERFNKYDVENAMTGIVTVRLLRLWGLAAAGDSLSCFVRVTSSANRKEWRSRVVTWTRRNHINRLKAEMTRLTAARERDLREGRFKEAERKAEYLKALTEATDPKTARASYYDPPEITRLKADMTAARDRDLRERRFKEAEQKTKYLEALTEATARKTGRVPYLDPSEINRLKAELTAARNRDLREGRFKEAEQKTKYLEALTEDSAPKTARVPYLDPSEINGLKAELTAACDRDLREGRFKEAEQKTKYLEALTKPTTREQPKARLIVDMDFSLDSSAMHAIYHVKLTDVIKIKVLESSLLAANECLGRLDIPVSDIITANDFNPMTGQREFGLHRKRWEDYDPAQPERQMENLERGILLDEGDGGRIWLELRWVPCIQAVGPLADDAQSGGPAAHVDGSQAEDA